MYSFLSSTKSALPLWLATSVFCLLGVSTFVRQNKRRSQKRWFSLENQAEQKNPKKMNSALFLCTVVVLFGMGALGTFQNRRNFLIMLLCIEVMLLSVNLVFQTGSVTVDDQNGQLLALWVLTAAAAETALGQALCVLYFRLRSTLDVEQISLMKGSKVSKDFFTLFCSL